MVPTSLGKSTLLAMSTAATSMLSSIPTGEDRRSRTTTTLRILSSLLATSATKASAMSTTPTGEKSPYTIIFSGAYVVRLDGDLYGYDTDSSYGTDRRAHVVPVPATYILSTRMVTSLATENTTFQTIPTGIFSIISVYKNTPN